jgi:hypothetical protein
MLAALSVVAWALAAGGGNGVCGRSPGADPLRPANGTSCGIASENGQNSKASIETHRCDPLLPLGKSELKGSSGGCAL